MIIIEQITGSTKNIRIKNIKYFFKNCIQLMYHVIYSHIVFGSYSIIIEVKKEDNLTKPVYIYSGRW